MTSFGYILTKADLFEPVASRSARQAILMSTYLLSELNLHGLINNVWVDTNKQSLMSDDD